MTISTNALGFRDGASSSANRTESFASCYSGSITFGYGVSAEETYGRKLEAILASRLSRGSEQ